MELMESIFRRRSGRKYTEEPVPEESLRAILEAGLLAPHSRGLDSVELITVREPLALAPMKAAGAAMLKTASRAVVAVGRSGLSDAWIEDCSIAMTLMMLRATELGVANCWVQVRNRYTALKAEDGSPISAEQWLRDRLNLPEDCSVLAVLSLGTPAAETTPHTAEDADWTKVHSERF